MSLLHEIKRRNVARAAIAYAIVAWLLLQFADVLLDNLEAPDWAFEAVLLILAIGFVVVAVFSWVFELTPEGLKRDVGLDSGESTSRDTGRKLDRVIIFGLIAVIAFLLAERFWPASPETSPAISRTEAAAAEDAAPARRLSPPQKSVAVIPFAALSSGEDDGYFADGLTEEIINVLAALPDLLVTARTSAFHFKDQDLPVPEIAARLGVDHVVEGSVRRSGERMRVTAQLIRARDGFHLWSDTYDRTLSDVFAVQEDIAANVAEALEVVLDEDTLARMRGVGIGDVAAFIAYQKGVEAYLHAHDDYIRIVDDLELALPHFERALESAPDLFSARLLKADYLAHKVFDVAIGLVPETYEGEARQAMLDLRQEYELAFESAPLGIQRDILDVEKALFQEDWTNLASRLQRALQPADCPIATWTNVLAIASGFTSQAVERLRERLRCDPYDPMARPTLAYALVWLGDFRGALEEVEESRSRGIERSWLGDIEFMARLALGEFDLPGIEDEPRSGTWSRSFPRQLVALSLSGQTDAARAAAGPLWAEPGADDMARLIVAAMIGDRERANEYAARIDARPGSAMALSSVIYTCLCGAPFDLEAAPNLAARYSEAGFAWPPEEPIDFPAKDW